MNNTTMPRHQLLALFFTILLGSSTFAEAANGHWVVGGSIGTANVDETVSGFRFDANSTTYRIYGGYLFNEYFGLEFGYLDLGDFNERITLVGNVVAVNANADGFTFAVLGTVPLSEKFALHASFGSFFWDGDSEIGGIDNNVSEANLFFGAGATLAINDKFSLRTDISRYELDGPNANVFSAGFQISFD